MRNIRLREKINGADSAKGGNKMHQGENRMSRRKSRITGRNKRHKSEEGKTRLRREIKGAESAQGQHKILRRKHKLKGRKDDGEKQTVQVLQWREITCMREKM